MSLFPEWEAEHANDEVIPQRVLAMFKRYGRGEPGKICKTCKHFVGYRRNKTFYKCELFGVTHGEATDWRGKYPACGKYEEDTNGTDQI